MSYIKLQAQTTREALEPGRGSPIVAVVGLRGLGNVIGGVEAHCERLYPQLAKAAAHIDFHIVTRSRYSPVRSHYEGLDVRALWAPRHPAFEALTHTFTATLYARWKLRADVIHFHGIGPALFAPLARLLGMKVIVTHHAADFLRPKWGWPARLGLKIGELFTAQFARKIICVSESLQAEFLARHPHARERTTTIRHGMAGLTPSRDTSILQALGLRSGEYVLAVGRLDETKRFEDIIAAQEQLGEATPTLVIAGSAFDRSTYASSLQAKANSRLIFAGYRQGAELATLYQEAGLFVHASEMEGFGLVVMEALSVGTPVRISDIPAHREFRLDPAAYFPVGDVATIAAMISKGAGSTAQPNWLTLKARYSAEQAVSLHAAVLSEVISS